MTTEARRPVFTKEATLTRSDSSATKLFSLPKWTRITEILVTSSAAAAGATLTLGTLGTAAKYVSAQGIASAGINRPATTGNDYTTLTEREDIYASIGGSPVAGGPFRVIVVCTTEKKTFR